MFSYCTKLSIQPQFMFFLLTKDDWTVYVNRNIQTSMSTKKNINKTDKPFCI